MSRDPSSTRASPATPGGRARHRVSYRRAFWISMGVSALLHIAALALYPKLLLDMPAGGVFPGGGGPVDPAVGTELLNLRELSDREFDALPQEAPQEEPEPAVAPVAPGGEVATPGAGQDEPEGGGISRTNADLLKPREGDLRLWAPPDPELNQPSPEDLMRLRLMWELELMGDSAAMAEELARRAQDWTYTDEEGRRWGVSPGKIHLGDLTLPLPFGFGPPPELREQMQNRVWEWDEIRRGAASAELRQSWKDRNEAIRRRKEAERKPDTTGVRRR